MDNVVINITELPNNVSLQITEDVDNVTINVTEGYFTCSDLNSCQVITDLQTDLSTHISDNGNPHNVTASQVGLGNVDNTSDADKPVSIAQQTELNLKEDKSNKVTNFNSPNNTDYATTQATINLVDNRVQSNIKIIGDWDATSGSMPLDDESNTTPFITQWGATIKVGWAFRVGYGQAGTVGGFDYEEGDVVYALIDNAGPTPADWGDLDHNLQQANESLRGTAKVITAAIISDETTTDDEKFVTGKKLWLNFWTRVLAISHTFAAKITFTTAPRFNSTTANQRLEVDANKDMVSVAMGTADNKNFGENVGDVMRGEEIVRMKSPFHTTTIYDHAPNTIAANAVFSSMIPAGTLKGGDILRVQFKLLRLSGTGSAFIRIYNTTSALSLGSRIAQNSSTTGGATQVVTRNFRIAPDGLSMSFISGAIAFSSDEVVNTNLANESAIIFDVNVDQYFRIGIEMSVATDVYRLYYVYSQIIRP